MLADLHVRNLGVIREVTVRFEPGMTAVTGETGAGKTLLVHALQLVLGGRAEGGRVRSGAPEAAVEARFATAGGHGTGSAESGGTGVELPRAGGETADDDEVFLARSLPVRGRSRAWVGGRMAPLAALEAAGAGLVDIHGQHDHQMLLGASGQRRVLDDFAGSDLAPLAAARRALAAVDARRAALGGDDRARAREVDLLRYQIAEIAQAGIEDPDEDARLRTEEARLADVAALREAAARAAAALDGEVGTPGDLPSALSRAGEAVGAISGHEPFGAHGERLRAVVAELGDVASELRRASESMEEDPLRLEHVQERRRALAELRRKYGDTLADVIAFAGDARHRLGDFEAREAEAAVLARRRDDAQLAVREQEAALRHVRAEAAPRLAAAVTERLRTLAMPDACLRVEVGERGAGDDVQLLLSANRGEPPQPLSRVASGGELSRTMLALRLVVEGGAPTMLFDEVDAGVGGTAAVALASALHEVALHRQVLVVTHLPQVAAAADHQLAVRKSLDDDGRTVTVVEALEGPARVAELSRMLSGHPDSATARAHAEELLGVSPRVAAPPGPARAPASTTRRGTRD